MGDRSLWVGVLVMFGLVRSFCAGGSAGHCAANRKTCEGGRGKKTARGESGRLLGRRTTWILLWIPFAGGVVSVRWLARREVSLLHSREVSLLHSPGM